MTYIICCEDSERINGRIKIGDTLYYLKACQKGSAVYTNLKLKYADADEDKYDSEEDQIDVEEEYIDSDEILREKYRYRKLSYYAGLVPAQLEPLQKEVSETESLDVWLYVRPRFDCISIQAMLDAIINDNENKEYFNTGDAEDDKLISFGQESIADILSDEIEIIYPEGKDEPDKSNTDNKTKVEEVEKTINAVKNTLNADTAFAINLSVLFECYARIWVKCNINNYFMGYTMQPYVPNKKEKELAYGSGYKNICIPHKAENGKIYIDGIALNDNGIYLDGNIIPDIVLEKETNGKSEYIILDAKYKDPTGRQDRDDRLQLLAYAFMYDAAEIGHIFPKNERSSETQKPFRVNVEKNLLYKMYFVDCNG